MGSEVQDDLLDYHDGRQTFLDIWMPDMIEFLGKDCRNLLACQFWRSLILIYCKSGR